MEDINNNPKIKNDNDELNEKVNSIITNHVYSSIGVGLIPIPVVDLFGLAIVQLNMLRKMANLYGIPFSEEKVKNIISPLIGSSLATGISKPFSSFLKAIPIIGQTTGVLSMSFLGAASTYALGKVFERHFSTGGTFLTFDHEKVKNFYFQMIEEGELFVSDLKKKKESTKADETKSDEKKLDEIKTDENKV